LVGTASEEEKVAKKTHEQEFAIIGLGRFGSSLAIRLEELGQSVLGIEIDPRRAKEISDHITETVILDATDPEALGQADITSFKTVIVAIEDDFEATALITSSLKGIGIPTIICVAGSRRHKEILLRIGADRVIIPKEESGFLLADELSTPGMLQRLPLNPDYSLIEIHAPAGMVMKKIRDCERLGVSILLILRGNELILAPDPEIQMAHGDVLLVLGEIKHLIEFSALT
jgi:trk system potassium uptake protein TrkA